MSQDSQTTRTPATSLRRLRLGILAISAAVMIGHAANEYGAMLEEKAEAVDGAVRNAETLLISLDEHLGRTLQAAESMIRLGASQIEAELHEREFDTAAIHKAFIDIHRGTSQLRGLGFIDAFGNLSFYTTPNPDPAQPRINAKDREYFTFHRAHPSSEVLIGRPSPSRATGDMIVPLTRRVNHPDGSFAGVVLGALEAAYFNSFYSRLGTGTRALSIFGSDAIMLVRMPSDPKQVGTSFAHRPLFRDHIGQHESGWYRRPAEGDESARYVVYRRATGIPFVLAATIEEPTILAAWHEKLPAKLLTVAGVLLALAMFTGLLLRTTYRQERLAVDLQASEAQFRDFAQSSSDWQWETGPDHRFTRFVGKVDRLDELKAAFLGKSRVDIADPNQLPPGWQQHVQDINAHRPFRDFIYRRVSSDGVIRYAKTSGTPVFGGNGEFLGYRGTASDVTDVVLAEEHASASRKLLANAIETLHEGFVLFDAQDRFVRCNSKFREIYAESADLLVPGTHYENILRHAAELGQFPESIGRTGKWIKQAMAYHHIMASTRQRQLPGGRWVEVREVKLAEGGSVGIHIDITETKLAQEQLRESEERLRSIAANLTQVILEFSVDREGVIHQTFVSERCQDLLGYTADEIMADPMIFARIIEPEFLAAYCQTLADAERAMAPVEVEYRFRRRDGEKRWARSMLRPRQGPDGTVLWDGTINDATEEKAAEGQRRELENQLRHLQRIEAVGTLAGGMAHEINNKLVPIVTFSELMLMKTAEDDPNHRPLQTIHDAAERIRDLVARILSMSRSETPGSTPIEIKTVAANAIDLLRATLRPNVRLSLEADGAGSVRGDGAQLEQVLVNLCTNAAHAIGTNQGHIRLAVDEIEIDEGVAGAGHLPRGHYARLRVIDNGCGMTPQTTQRVFEPFFTTKSVGEGTGLGLSIVHGIIVSHGGRITVESAVGEGTTFTILLPRSVANESSPKEPAANDDATHARPQTASM